MVAVLKGLGARRKKTGQLVAFSLPSVSSKIVKKGVSKYGNVPKGGCDSTAEYNRWVYLKMLLKSKLIWGLRRHVLYKFRDGAYEADFIYFTHKVLGVEYPKGKLIVEDVKHPVLLRGAKFVGNKKKMLAEYGLEIWAIKPSKVRLPLELSCYSLPASLKA